MKIFVPAGNGEIETKKRWFEKPICDKLRERGVEFGFEIKGSVKGLRKLTVPYGIHLRNELATEWMAEQGINNKRKKIQQELEELEAINSLDPAPMYVILHGGNVVDAPCPEREDFVSGVAARTYLQAIEDFVALITHLQKVFDVPIALETMYHNRHVIRGEVILPKTYLCLRIGVLGNELRRIAQRCGCLTVADWEHLHFTLNFAKRRSQYVNLSQKLPSDLIPSEKALIQECGIFLRKGYTPVFPEADSLSFEGEMKHLGAKISHVCGNQGGYVEHAEGKVALHMPIRSDMALEGHLRTALATGSKIFVVEVVRPEDNVCFADRSSNDQERSFENFCWLVDLETP